MNQIANATDRDVGDITVVSNSPRMKPHSGRHLDKLLSKPNSQTRFDSPRRGDTWWSALLQTLGQVGKQVQSILVAASHDNTVYQFCSRNGHLPEECCLGIDFGIIIVLECLTTCFLELEELIAL